MATLDALCVVEQQSNRSDGNLVHFRHAQLETRTQRNATSSRNPLALALRRWNQSQLKPIPKASDHHSAFIIHGMLQFGSRKRPILAHTYAWNWHGSLGIAFGIQQGLETSTGVDADEIVDPQSPAVVNLTYEYLLKVQKT